MALATGLAVYVNGIDLANYFKDFSVSADQESLDATVLASTSKVYVPAFKNGSAQASGVYDADTTNANKIYDVFKAAFANQSTVYVGQSNAAPANGGTVSLFAAQVLNWSVEMPLAQLIMTSAGFQADGGVYFGKWLYNASLNNTSANSSSVDNGAASSNGAFCAAFLQNTSATVASCSVKFQHSTDNSTWVDLGTAVSFTAYATNYGYLTASYTGTVNRYVRAVVTTSGGTATVQAALARK